ncbi:hypothetical protein LUZ63_007856 [Rhynchospora breviuscula]|uniref:Exopolygalacturonase n=1 Tax=Rhynchospora breviuscula TaxID=2022672 RepID=A0A9Q0HUV3_9POAL|nr:hypothetical protein LUZ63_007856 [Rhynchospora breviuscula]
MASSMLFKITLISCLAMATAHKKAAPPADSSGSTNSTGSTGSNIFDVTKYSASTSASPSANSKAFLEAFKAACKVKGRPTFLVPKGTYQLGPVTFEGPCQGTHITFEIQGTLVAPPDVKSIPGNAWIEFDSLHEMVLQGGGVFDGQGQSTWPLPSHNKPISIRLMKCVIGRITNITSKNSKFFHMSLHHAEGIIIENLKIVAPGHSKNTDGIHISGSSNITLNNIDIGTGDDCISIGPGTNNVIVTGIKCGPGHGLSIGSLGKYKDEEDVGNIHVKNCTLAGTTNGVRIKTWPGAPPSEAFNITFDDVTMTNVSYPIIIDQKYCPNGECTTHAPSLVKLRDIRFSRIRGTSNTPVAVKLACSDKEPCQNVKLQDISLKPLTSAIDEISSFCTNVHGAVSGIQNPDPCLGPHPGNSSNSDSSSAPSPAPTDD